MPRPDATNLPFAVGSPRNQVHDPAHRDRARSYAAEGKYRQAAADFKKAASLMPAQRSALMIQHNQMLRRIK